jgi:hypothetical protein
MFGYNLDINIAIEKAIDEIVFLYGTKAEIMLLGRTNYDINKLNFLSRNY